MGRIKSALEIALEKTESVRGDKSAIDQYEAKQRGKKLANDFLEDPSLRLEEALKKIPKDQQASFKEGLFDVLFTQITLPALREDMARIEAAGKGLQIIIGDSRFNGLFKQFTQILGRYLEESAQYEEVIKRQYAPKLRQKEEELSRRMGRQIRLDPFQDPEFIAFFNQNMNALKGNYEAAANQIREEAERMFRKV